MSPGSAVTLVCVAAGRPPPHITWTFSGPRGPPLALGHRQHLLLEAVSGGQAGVYRCLATSSLGSQRAEVHLTVGGLLSVSLL